MFGAYATARGMAISRVVIRFFWCGLAAAFVTYVYLWVLCVFSFILYLFLTQSVPSHSNYICFQISQIIAGRFWRNKTSRTLIHFIFGYMYLYWVFMLLCVWSSRCWLNFQLVTHYLRCLINHFFNFSSGFIRYIHIYCVL